IAGLEEPSSGEVLIGGRGLTRPRPAGRHAALGLPTLAPDPPLNGGGNVHLGLHVRRVPPAAVPPSWAKVAAPLWTGALRQPTPAEVYGRPADVFVARFIGNPGMNILRGRARGAGEEGGIVDCGSWSVPVPLERYEGEIYLGVRPEHVSLVAPDQGVGAAEVR